MLTNFGFVLNKVKDSVFLVLLIFLGENLGTGFAHFKVNSHTSWLFFWFTKIDLSFTKPYIRYLTQQLAVSVCTLNKCLLSLQNRTDTVTAPSAPLVSYGRKTAITLQWERKHILLG